MEQTGYKQHISFVVFGWCIETPRTPPPVLRGPVLRGNAHLAPRCGCQKRSELGGEGNRAEIVFVLLGSAKVGTKACGGYST